MLIQRITSRKRVFQGLAGALLLGATLTAMGATVQSLARVGGNRVNRVIGYGLVVGLPGTGDQTTEVPYTTQTITNMLRHMGLNLPAGQFMQPNNDAAVMVTGSIPPEGQPGQKFTVTVSAMGNTSSLRGGILLMTQLHAANGQVVAQAQGPLLVTGSSAQGVTASETINNPDVGQVQSGGTVEVAMPADQAAGGVPLLLRSPNFIMAARMVSAINQTFPGSAIAQGSGIVMVRAPSNPDARVNFLAALEQIQVTAPQPVPTVEINAQDGTVIMGANIRISPCAVATGSLSVSVRNNPQVSQPNMFGQGVTVATSNSKVKIASHKAHIVLLDKTSSLEGVVRTLNTVGATPAQLISILEAMKAEGALHARIKVI